MSAAREPALPERLFPQPLLDSLAAYPERVAFEHGSRVVTYGEQLGMIRDLVEGMRSVGLGPGKDVGMLTAQTPEGFAANAAAHALGCTVAGIRPGWSPSHLADVLSSGFDAIVVDPSTLTDELDETIRGLADPPDILSVPVPRSSRPGPDPDTAQADPTIQGEDAQSEAGLLAPYHGAGPLAVEARPIDIARLNFTSGSTGRPKACARTYRTFSLLFEPERWAPDLARMVSGCRRFLTYGSWSIPVRFTFAARCLITGGTVVIADDSDGLAGGAHSNRQPGDQRPSNHGPRDRGPSEQGPAAPDLANAIARHRITGVTMNVPALHRTLTQLRKALDIGLERRSSRRSPSKASSDVNPLQEAPDISCLEAVVVSGSPASPALLASAIDLLGPVIWQGYGQAESGMISLLTPEDIAREPDTALTSVGRPLPDVEISVRSPDEPPSPLGREPSATGEIYVCSPQMMSGYWNDPQGSKEILGEDGWLRTRDLGYIDQTTGLLHLTGRSRDVIMVNAEICYTGAVEKVLTRHPHVDQAYVIGVPDEQTGEAIHAFVIPTSGHWPPDRNEAPGRTGTTPPSGIPAVLQNEPGQLDDPEGQLATGPAPPEPQDEPDNPENPTGTEPLPPKLQNKPDNPADVISSAPIPAELEDELAGLVRAELTANHVPKTVTTIREVPVAASGKPDKQALAKFLDPTTF